MAERDELAANIIAGPLSPTCRGCGGEIGGKGDDACHCWDHVPEAQVDRDDGERQQER